MKIAVHYYTEITDLDEVNGIELNESRYTTSINGKSYLVEILG